VCYGTYPLYLFYANNSFFPTTSRDLSTSFTRSAEQMHNGPNIYLQISAGWGSGGWGQALFSGAQQQDKGQRAQTEAEEAPAEHEEELLPSECDGALAQAAQGGCGVSFSEIFKTHLDKVLYSLL